jgi:hypothetical protein
LRRLTSDHIGATIFYDKPSNFTCCGSAELWALSISDLQKCDKKKDHIDEKAPKWKINAPEFVIYFSRCYIDMKLKKKGIVICNKKTKYLNLSRTFRKFKKCPRVLYFDSGPLIWPNDERGRINRFLNALHGGLMFGPLLLGRVEYLWISLFDNPITMKLVKYVNYFLPLLNLICVIFANQLLLSLLCQLKLAD